MYVSRTAAGYTTAKKKSDKAEKVKAPKARKRAKGVQYSSKASGVSVTKQEGGGPAAPKAKNKQKRNVPQQIVPQKVKIGRLSFQRMQPSISCHLLD